VIENVITETTLRDRGYGRQLMAEALNYCWDSGCYKAMLLTGSDKKSTHEFYLSCGFSAREKTGYIARPLG